MIKLIIAIFRIRDNTADTVDILENIEKKLNEIELNQKNNQ